LNWDWCIRPCRRRQRRPRLKGEEKKRENRESASSVADDGKRRPRLKGRELKSKAKGGEPEEQCEEREWGEG